MDREFVKDWDRFFDTIARINPVKLSASSFPLTLTEVQDLFKSIAMGIETEEVKLRPTMLVFLKDLEPMFQALPVKVFGPQQLKREYGLASSSHGQSC